MRARNPLPHASCLQRRTVSRAGHSSSEGYNPPPVLRAAPRGSGCRKPGKARTGPLLACSEMRSGAAWPSDRLPWPQPIPWDRRGWRGDCQAAWMPPRSRAAHSTAKTLSSGIITAEFYINGNFQLSHSSVSVRGPGTGGISQRRTERRCGRTGPPGMTPTTTQRGCTGSLHAKTSSQQKACLQRPGEMLCLSRNPTLASQWGFTRDRAEEVQKQAPSSPGKHGEKQFVKQRF